MDKSGALEQIIAPTVEAMGYELVRVQTSGAHELTLQVMAERCDGAAMTVDDCAEISRAVSAVLDVEDPIASAYLLEVSSPGIDRPLTRAKDFERFAGHEAKFETRELVSGRKRFRGILRGIAGDVVTIETDEGAVAVPFAMIQKAKLMMTDALLAATAQQQGPVQ